MRSLDDPRRPMKSSGADLLPLWFRRGVLAIVSATVVGAFVFTDASSRTDDDHGAVVASRDLRFVDLDNGGVVVLDDTDAARLLSLRSGEGSFVRGVMRSFARERLARGLDDDEPFRLLAWESGLLSLEDTLTGDEVALSAFGATNVAEFAALLPPDIGR